MALPSQPPEEPSRVQAGGETAVTSNSSPRFWIVPRNDLESLTIHALLQREGERVRAAAQPWGATWDGVEPAVLREWSEFHAGHPDAVLYGVELSGRHPENAVDIDHHRYADDDRSSALSSLEQVAAILGVALDRRMRLIALNDRAWIPGMAAEGASREEILEIRRLDRSAQGVTAEQEEQARHDLRSARRERATWIVHCPGGPSSAHSDFLFEREGKVEPVLLIAPRQWLYSGPQAAKLAGCQWEERFWSGGAPDFGFFGIDSPGAESQMRLHELLA